MEVRRCGECGQVIQATRAPHPQTKYCGHCAKRRIRQPKAAPICNDEFESPVKARSDTLDDVVAEFDALLAGMQTSKARKGMKAAFSASSAELGRAAVKASRKRR